MHEKWTFHSWRLVGDHDFEDGDDRGRDKKEDIVIRLRAAEATHSTHITMFSARNTIKTFAAVRPTQQVRFKRDKAGLNPQLERIVNQLSVLSAGRKQPRLLKLCNEDYVKHKTVMKAWSLHRNNLIAEKKETLRKQYESMDEAVSELEKLSPQLYEVANQHQYGKRFPLEIRVPAEFPPRQIWFYEYFPKKQAPK